jgi:hypothetical protein
MPRNQHAGRIRPDERDTDDAATTLGASLPDIGEEYDANYNASLELSLSKKCRTNYQCRIVRVAKFWQENCPSFYVEATKEVSAQDLVNESKFYYGRHKVDLIYKGFNVKYLLHYLMTTTRKANGKMKSHQDVRKYKEAIMWAASVVGERLPTTFFVEMDKYLASYKKQIIKPKKKGEVNESESDPIPLQLYQLMLVWAIESNNIFVWFWTLSQWACMARCASIDPLGFHNFRVSGQGSLGCKYDDQKADKSGERLSEKNIYANPFEWTQ